MGVLIAGLEMEKEEALRHRVSPRLATGLVPLADQEILVGGGG
jgi:hypothetical protein